MASSVATANAHHRLAVHEVVLLMETDAEVGLSDGEATSRLGRYGHNVLPAAETGGALVRLGHQLNHPLIYVLLAAGTVTTLLGEYVDAGVIFGVVVINALVGFVQESKAEAVLDALRAMVLTEATVVRDGEVRRVPSERLVPGDLVSVEAGDKVPADLRLVRITELAVDESALTGESVPVVKDEVVMPEPTPVADRRNMVFSGTLVTAGTGAGIAVATGARTELGEIHRLVGTADVLATPLTRKLARLSKILTLAILVLAGVTFGVGLLRGEGTSEMFTAAVALAVGAIPEGLPAAVTITLAIGVARMARRRAVIRRLPAVETLGGTEPSSEYPLDTPATIPLSAIRNGGLVQVHLPVTTGYSATAHNPNGPTLALDCGTGTCPGVYPLELVLLDRASGVPLASLTTYLVYAPRQPGSLPLEVGLVLPLGSHPALTPAGGSELRPHQLSRLAGLLRVLTAAPQTPLTLELHGQLLEALARSSDPQAKELLGHLAVLGGGTSASAGEELATAPFAAPAVDALTRLGLGGELDRQLAASRTAIDRTLHTTAAESPYVVGRALDPAGLGLLGQQGVSSVVVPPSSLATPTAPVSTPTAPLLVADAGRSVPAAPPPAGTVPKGTTEVVLSDPGLATAFDAPAQDPVLAAHQFLAEVASVYFDDPFATQPRGVVVTSRTLGSSNRFLATVLAGLGGSPGLQPETLARFVDSVPVGANDAPTAATLRGARADQRGPNATQVRDARATLGTLRSVVPTARFLATQLEQSILLGESAGLSNTRRAAYEHAPEQALRSIGKDLSLAGVRTTTLTSRSGRIPVTVQSTLSVPVHVVLRLRSSELTFAANRSLLTIPLDLTGKAIQSDVRVSARTSGSSRLEISLLSPRDGYVLLDESVAVHSTAISGVAVALSAGALLVLIGWWVRSAFRRRRRGRAVAPAPASAAGPS